MNVAGKPTLHGEAHRRSSRSPLATSSLRAVGARLRCYVCRLPSVFLVSIYYQCAGKAVQPYVRTQQRPTATSAFSPGGSASSSRGGLEAAQVGHCLEQQVHLHTYVHPIVIAAASRIKLCCCASPIQPGSHRASLMPRKIGVVRGLGNTCCSQFTFNTWPEAQAKVVRSRHYA